MTRFARLLAATALVAAASAAQAVTVIVNFDNLATGVQAGTVNGLVFNNFQVSSGFGPSTPPNFAYNTATTAGFDYAAGFNSFTFTSGVFSATTVSVFSGLSGSGTLLGSVTVTDPPASPNAFSPWSVAFAGTGRSVVVVNNSGQFAWDDVTVGTAVPEPASWAMLIAGFGLVGAAARRRRAAMA